MIKKPFCLSKLNFVVIIVLFTASMGCKSKDETSSKPSKEKWLQAQKHIEKNVIVKYPNSKINKSGDSNQTITYPTGATRTISNSNTYKSINNPDGSSSTTSLIDDERFGSQAPVVSNKSVSTGYEYLSFDTVVTTTFSPTNVLKLDSETVTTTFDSKDWVREYDGLTQTYTYKTPLLRESKVVLNSNDQVVETQSASFLPVEYGYDVKGRLSTIDQGVRNWTYAYNVEDEVESVTNPLNETVTYVYDDNSRLIEAEMDNGDKLFYQYDDNGNLTGIKAGTTGPWHNLVYSTYNYLMGYVYPNVGTGTQEIEFEYNDDKQLVKVTKPGALVIDYDYDLTTGLLNQIETPEGDYVYTHNAVAEQVTDVVAPNSVALSYTYQNDLLDTQTTTDGAVTTAHTYTYENGLPKTQTLNTVAANSRTSSITYNYDNDMLLSQAGHVTLTRDLDTGLIEQTKIGTNLTEAYTYNSNFAELEEMEAKYSTTNILKQTFTRDALGRITGVTELAEADPSKAYTYEYDSRGRLEKVYVNSVLQRHYFYDANSNRLKIEDATATPIVTATYDDQDRILTYGNYTFTYTDYGHTYQKTNSSTNIRETLSFDSMGGLTGYTQVNTSTSATLMNVVYTNDAFGRRIKKFKGGTFQKRYIYDAGIRIIGELNNNGSTLTHYIYAEKAHVPSYMIRANVRYKIITNPQGSVRYVVNQANGTIVQEMDYDEFGNVTLDTSPGFQPFGFAGGLYDPDTKLVRFGAREFDALTGRWISKDPVLFGGGTSNLYSYSIQDPINFIDINGLAPEDVDRAINIVKKRFPKLNKTLIDKKVILPKNIAGQTVFKENGNRIEINASFSNSCLNDDGKMLLLQTVFHEALHNQDSYSQAIKDAREGALLPKGEITDHHRDIYRQGLDLANEHSAEMLKGP